MGLRYKVVFSTGLPFVGFTRSCFYTIMRDDLHKKRQNSYQPIQGEILLAHLDVIGREQSNHSVQFAFVPILVDLSSDVYDVTLAEGEFSGRLADEIV